MLVDKYIKEYLLSDPWDVVDLFEKKLAEYGGSKYAVAVDNCTDAMFLCLKYLKAGGEVTLPKRTYVSVPCTVIHAGCKVKFEDIEWSGAYQLNPYPVWDGATRMQRGMYVKDSYYCLSFHRRKHIPIGKGGMILTDDKRAYEWFKVARYEGRHMDKFYKDDYIVYYIHKGLFEFQIVNKPCVYHKESILEMIDSVGNDDFLTFKRVK